MRKLYFLVFEPMKYDWKIAPVQVLIQIRTWGKATHVGMVWNEEDFEAFLSSIKKDGSISRKKAKEKFYSAGQMVSATFPKVTVENIFDDYVNDRIFIKSVEVSDYQYRKVHSYWLSRIGKEKYSLLGLVWFVVAPFIDWIKNTKDIEPNKGFCSEVATNILYASGVKVFTFMCNKFEDDLLLARSLPLHEFKKLCGDKIQGMDVEKFWRMANTSNKFYYGYKVSPRMFKLSPALKCEGILEIHKDRVVYVE